MTQYVLRRMLQLIPILLGVTLLIFCLFTYFGEDPARSALGAHATPQKIEALRHKWGIDRPFLQQYGTFLKEVATADFGRSYVTNEKLSDMFAEGASVSLAVTVPPFVIGTLLNICIALVVVWYRGSLFAKGMSVIFTSAMSISYLVYVLFCQYFLAYRWNMFEISGYMPGWRALSYLMLPWIIQMIVML